MALNITKYCQIKNRQFFINGLEYFSFTEAKDDLEFLTTLYRNEKINYPKFFKMDSFAKTGFLASDLLLRDTCYYDETPKLNMGLFLSNKYSSLDTDETYSKTTTDDNYFPSPSVFVYTLPNIVMGEIAIKHKVFGENTFFVSESFDVESVLDYVNQAFADSSLKNAIVGWADFYKGLSNAFLILVEKQEQAAALHFDKETIIKLIK
jgi:hypothetical protein